MNRLHEAAISTIIFIIFIPLLLTFLVYRNIYNVGLDPKTTATFTGVVEMIDDTTMELNTGQDSIQIQLDLDDTKILKHMIHQGTKGSFYLTHHKKSDIFVLKGLTHYESDGLFSSKREDNVKIIE